MERLEAQSSPGGRTGGVSMSDAPAGLQGQGWRTLDEIARQLDVPRREVEQLIEGWRLVGKPIVGGAKGVKWTDDPRELAMYLEARRRRLVSIYAGNRALRVTLRRMRMARDADQGLTLWDAA